MDTRLAPPPPPFVVNSFYALIQLETVYYLYIHSNDLYRYRHSYDIDNNLMENKTISVKKNADDKSFSLWI